MSGLGRKIWAMGLLFPAQEGREPENRISVTVQPPVWAVAEERGKGRQS